MRRALLLCSLLGCGSSVEPTRPVVEPVPSGSIASPPTVATIAPPRTLVQVGLFGGTSTDNLILDPTFDHGGPGIGRWINSVDGKSSDFGQATDARTPKGSSLPYGIFENEKSMTLLAQLPGGPGPYVARLWVSSESGGGDATLAAVKVSLANAAGSGLTSTDVPSDPASTRVLGGRTWTLFTGEAKGPFPLGGYLIIRVKATKQRWWMQGAEVLPKALASTMALRVVPTPRPLDTDERAAIEVYRAQPLVYGRPR